MTHRNPNQRWLDNPEHKVGKAQLNRVAQAANRSESPTGPQQPTPPRESRATDRILNQ